MAGFILTTSWNLWRLKIKHGCMRCLFLSVADSVFACFSTLEEKLLYCLWLCLFKNMPEHASKCLRWPSSKLSLILFWGLGIICSPTWSVAFNLNWGLLVKYLSYLQFLCSVHTILSGNSTFMVQQAIILAYQNPLFFCFRQTNPLLLLKNTHHPLWFTH